MIIITHRPNSISNHHHPILSVGARTHQNTHQQLMLGFTHLVYAHTHITRLWYQYCKSIGRRDMLVMASHYFLAVHAKFTDSHEMVILSLPRSSSFLPLLLSARHGIPFWFVLFLVPFSCFCFYLSYIYLSLVSAFTFPILRYFSSIFLSVHPSWITHFKICPFPPGIGKLDITLTISACGRCILYRCTKSFFFLSLPLINVWHKYLKWKLWYVF